MSGKRKWSERTRMLVLMELAIVLPAAALIGFSLWNLHSIGREKAVDAAIQRDFSYVLKMAEKRLNKQGFNLVAQVRDKFPCPDSKPALELDKLLEKYPQFAAAIIYSEGDGVIVRGQPARMEDWQFRREIENFAKNVSWIKMEAPEMVKGLHVTEEKRKHNEMAEEPYVTFAHWGQKDDPRMYLPTVLFTLPNAGRDRAALGGVVFDENFLRSELFPNVFRYVLTEDAPDKSQKGGQHNPAVIMLRPRREYRMMASSGPWEGKPEVEKYTEGAFPSLVLAMKLQGTTIGELGERFTRMNLWVIGGLSLLLAFGVGLTFRNVSREMQLARLKSDFVANVSHELRTPLALIRLYAETLELGRLSSEEKFQEYYQIIRKESERLTSLINNILDFSRIEAGKKEYSFSETNLADLVRQTLDSYRYQIEQQGFQYEERIAADIPPVRVDREAIARSLVNLVNNALKYSAKDKFLGVHLYRSNGDVKLEVVDHGIGITKQEMPRIFDKFYRAGDPLVHNTKGSGLGLSLVRHIVHAHGGRVSVDSAPGKGSKFTIALPLESRAVPQAQPAEA